VTDPVTVERDGHVLLIGVNRPAQRNAFDLAVIEALGAAYETLGTDQELRAGVLFGHGDHFSAGLDLAQVGPAVAQDGPGALGSSHRFDPFGVWRDPVPKPVVLAVNGYRLYPVDRARPRRRYRGGR
jgi:enoyl-CoA hydratase